MSWEGWKFSHTYKAIPKQYIAIIDIDIIFLYFSRMMCADKYFIVKVDKNADIVITVIPNSSMITSLEI